MEDTCATCGHEGRLVGFGLAAYWTHVGRKGRSYDPGHDFIPLSQAEDEKD